VLRLGWPGCCRAYADPGESVPLTPSLPPGRANRKALRFGADIVRLRQAGYTFSAIRLALLEAGLDVGLTTIKREAARGRPVVASQFPAATQPETIGAAHVVNLQTAMGLRSSDARTGRETAEAFFDAHPSNPLFSTRESS
jgi:hypothetical protein